MSKENPRDIDILIAVDNIVSNTIPCDTCSFQTKCYTEYDLDSGQFTDKIYNECPYKLHKYLELIQSKYTIYDIKISSEETPEYAICMTNDGMIPYVLLGGDFFTNAKLVYAS